jgi:alkylation response protein AidB-like acyl-CoA dehydrogenase
MPRAMLDDADGTLALLRDSVAQFAEQHGGAKRLRAKRDRGDDLDHALWVEMARAGWAGLLLPEEFDGAGLGMREQAVVSEGLGYALIAEPVASLAVFSNTLIADAAASRERKRLAYEIAHGRVIASPAWCDPAPRRVRPERHKTLCRRGSCGDGFPGDGRDRRRHGPR